MTYQSKMQETFREEAKKGEKDTNKQDSMSGKNEVKKDELQ